MTLKSLDVSMPFNGSQLMGMHASTFELKAPVKAENIRPNMVSATRYAAREKIRMLQSKRQLLTFLPPLRWIPVNKELVVPKQDRSRMRTIAGNGTQKGQIWKKGV